METLIMNPAQNKRGTRLVQINDEISAILELFAREISYRCVVDFDVGNLPPIPCNAREIRKVLSTLLVNAAQAMPEKEGKLKIRTSFDGVFVKIDISDNGYGFSPEELGRIFDPLFSADLADASQDLGLPTSDLIVRKHGGALHVASTQGQGTEVTITLPQHPKLRLPEGDLYE